MRLIQIKVDLTETHRGLLHTTVHLPVPSPVYSQHEETRSTSRATFTTPLWLQASHAANGAVGSIAGLHFTTPEENTPLRWYRDARSTWEYHVDIPAGTDTVVASFDSILTRDIALHRALLKWDPVLLHHARRAIQTQRVQATIVVPAGWGVATALFNLGAPRQVSSLETVELQFCPTTVERLADSSVLAGLYLTTTPIPSRPSFSSGHGHFLSLAPDHPDYSRAHPTVLSGLSELITQTHLVFGHRHYTDYHFLVTLSDHDPTPGGIEGHDSTDIHFTLRGLASPEPRDLDEHVAVLAHEYVHSWCGKYRRPAGHAPPDFSTPLDNRLLWVYEGLTEYYGSILSVRSGLLSREGFEFQLANMAAWLDGQAGRSWRSIEDTATGSNLRTGVATGWGSWTRRQDYYYEGELLWLDVDTLIREKTDGEKSLDDFARAFFGRDRSRRSTVPEVVEFNLGEMVAGLNAVVGYDWLGFFREKVIDVAPKVDVDGIERAGYRFVYTDEPGERQETEEERKKAIWNSIGVELGGDEGVLTDVKRGGPADLAKLAPRQTIVKVGGAAFSIEALAKEIGTNTTGQINLTVRFQDETWEVQVGYLGGLRYPRIERVVGKHDLLSEILQRRRLLRKLCVYQKGLN